MGEMNIKYETNLPLQPPARSESFSLSDYYSDNEANDMDFNEAAKISQYRRAVQLIDRKCEALSRNNEKLIRRIHYVKSITKREERDILLLKARLDEYNDEWRTADTTDMPENHFPSLIGTSGQNKSKKSTTRKYKRNSDAANNSKNDGITTNGTAKEGPTKNADTKRKRQKMVKDQNASKRQTNSFFQLGVHQQLPQQLQ